MQTEPEEINRQQMRGEKTALIGSERRWQLEEEEFTGTICLESILKDSKHMTSSPHSW